MLKKLIALLTITIVAVGFCGCTEEEKTTTTIPNDKETVKETIKITDALGRDVEVPKEVNKIICYGPGASRLAVYLNATDKICGITGIEKKYCKRIPYLIAHKELLQKPVIGSGRQGEEPNVEKIIEIKPDVIFVTYMNKENADSLQQKTGIPVVVLSYGPLATFNNKALFKSLKIMGTVLNKEDRAKKVIKFIKDCQNDLNDRTKDIPDDKKPTVYIGGVRPKKGLLSTCPKYPPFVSVNAKNVADEINDNKPVVISKEKLLTWNPDVIFIDEAVFTFENDYNKNIEFYNSLKAFKNGDVYGILPYNLYMTNIGTALADAYYIGKILYPEKFSDINPEENADEIYTFLVGKPVYKEMAKEFGGFKRLKFE